jgi:hypothetical protein
MNTHLRPMGIREILDYSFFAIRERFWTFQGVIYLAYMPSLILILLIALIFGIAFFLAAPAGAITDEFFWSQLSERLGGFLPVLLLLLIPLSILFVISLILGSFWFAYGAMRIFDAWFHQTPLTVKDALRGAGSRLPNFFLFMLLIMPVACVIALPSFFLQMVLTLVDQSGILANIYSFIFNVALGYCVCLIWVIIIKENPDIFTAISRNFKLLFRKNLFWRNVGVYAAFQLIIQILVMITIFLLIFPIVSVVMVMVGTPNLPVYPLVIILAALLLISAGCLVLNILIPFYMGPLSFLYFDLIIRTEGYDIQQNLAERENEHFLADTKLPGDLP